MNTKQFLFLAICILSTSLTKTAPISMKNDTNYYLKVIVNGVVDNPYYMNPGDVKNLHRWGGGELDYKDFNRIQIQNSSISKVAPISELSTDQIKQDITNQPAFLEMGRKPCVIIKAGYTNWYLQSGWACK